MLLGIHICNFEILQNTTLGVTFAELTEMNAAAAADIYDPVMSSVPEERLPLGQLNIFIGRNSTGKSALFTALAFLGDCLRFNVAYASTKNGRVNFSHLKTSGIDADICFELVFNGSNPDEFLGYFITLSSDQHGRPYVAKETVKRAWFNSQGSNSEILLELENGKGLVRENEELKETAVADTKAPALAAFGKLLQYPWLNRIYAQITRWYFDQIQLKELEPLKSGKEGEGGHRHISFTGDNIKNVLEFLKNQDPVYYEEAIQRIAERMPAEKRIDKALNNGVSAGTRKLFALLLLLEDPDPRPLLCLEEPDAGLYHDMVDSLAFALRDYTIRHPDCQVLFTTHSPYILESMNPEEVWIFERPVATTGSGGETSRTVGFTRTRSLARDPVVCAMHQEGIGLGAMWYSGHLDRAWDEVHAKDDSE